MAEGDTPPADLEQPANLGEQPQTEPQNLMNVGAEVRREDLVG